MIARYTYITRRKKKKKRTKGGVYIYVFFWRAAHSVRGTTEDEVKAKSISEYQYKKIKQEPSH